MKSVKELMKQSKQEELESRQSIPVRKLTVSKTIGARGKVPNKHRPRNDDKEKKGSTTGLKRGKNVKVLDEVDNGAKQRRKRRKKKGNKLTKLERYSNQIVEQFTLNDLYKELQSQRNLKGRMR